MGVEGLRVLMYCGRGVDGADELVDVLPVAQGLDAAGGGAGADGDQLVAVAADLLDAAGVVVGGDGAFDQADVVGALQHGPAGFGEVGDVDGAGDAEEFVLGVEEAELAAVAGGELEDGDAGFAARFRVHIFRAGCVCGRRGRPGRPCR